MSQCNFFTLQFIHTHSDCSMPCSASYEILQSNKKHQSRERLFGIAEGRQKGKKHCKGHCNPNQIYPHSKGKLCGRSNAKMYEANQMIYLPNPKSQQQARTCLRMESGHTCTSGLYRFFGTLSETAAFTLCLKSVGFLVMKRYMRLFPGNPRGFLAPSKDW